MKIKGEEVKTQYGALNQIHKRRVQDAFDVSYMEGFDAVRKVVVNHYSKSDISQGPFMGIVLKALDEEPTLWSKLAFWKDAKLREYIIRVPEKDAHLPEPSTLEVEDTKSKDYKIIHTHNTFRAQSQAVSEENPCEPGDLVWVDYINDQCTFLGKVKNESTGAKDGTGPTPGVGPNDPNNSNYVAPPGGPFTAPQFAGYMKNFDYKGFFQGNQLSKYFHKIRLKKGVHPPSAAQPTGLNVTRTNLWDISPRMKDPGTRTLKKIRDGKGSYVRDDLKWVMGEMKTIINGLGGLFLGGSYYTGVATPSLRGLSEHSIGAAIDMHLGTTIQSFPTKEEHNLEVMTNRQDWVLWLKMPGPKTITHAGRQWKSEKVPIHAIKVKYSYKGSATKAPWNWKTITDGYYFNVTEAFNHLSMIGLGPLKRKRWWRDPWIMGYGEMWHHDHRVTHGYVTGKTTVGDVIDSQSFPGYATPARKARIPKYANATARKQYYKNGHFANGANFPRRKRPNLH